MGRRPRSGQWQRLGLMVLVSGLAAAGLALQPVPREEPPASSGRTAVTGPARSEAAAAESRRAPARAETVPLDAEPVLPAADGTAPLWPTAAAEADPAVWTSIPLSSPAPEAVVAVAAGHVGGQPLHLPVREADPTDSAPAVLTEALGLVDAMAGTGDGIEGFEPGMLYWFGPEGLERLEVAAMEAER